MYFELKKGTTFIFIIALNYVENSKIFMLFPMCTHSHYITGFPIAKELALRGHEVTFVSCYPLKTPINNFRNIEVEGLRKSINRLRPLFPDLQNKPVVATTSMARKLGDIMLEETLSYPRIQAILHSNESFDLVITEDFATPGFLGVAAHFSARSILVSSFRSCLWGNFYFANPEEPSYVPIIYHRMSLPMTFFQRVLNVFYVITEYVMREFVMLPTQDYILHKYLPKVPKLKKLVHNPNLMLVNSHISFDMAIPLLPNIIEIGGYHLEKPKRLPTDLQRVMDDAADGVIYFSLGSTIKSSDMKLEQIQIILNVLAELKQVVLWKCDNESIPLQHANIIISNWFPQNDILAHPNVKVFITQGGMMSGIEAVYHGVPILGLPIFADQYANINRAVKKGYALGFSSLHFTEVQFRTALRKLINNPKYRKIAKHWSKLFRDRPMKPLDAAMYWIEYVIRNGGGHFKSPAIDLMWYQNAMLDVVVFYFVVILCFLYILRMIFIGILYIRIKMKLSYSNLKKSQ